MEIKYTDIMKPEDISVEKIWNILANFLFKDKKVSQVQHDEMRRTFYMGFTECFKIMTDLSGTLTEDQATNVLTNINKEVDKFHEQEIGKLIGGNGIEH